MSSKEKQNLISKEELTDEQTDFLEADKCLKNNRAKFKMRFLKNKLRRVNKTFVPLLTDELLFIAVENNGATYLSSERTGLGDLSDAQPLVKSFVTCTNGHKDGK